MILVTGGLGMIGAQTARALADLGRDVIVTAHTAPLRPSFLDGQVIVERVDVTDPDAFLALGERHEISDIVHLAGSVPDADPVAFFRTDTAGLLTLWTLPEPGGPSVRRRQQPRLVHGLRPRSPGTRTSPCRPRQRRTRSSRSRRPSSRSPRTLCKAPACSPSSCASAAPGAR